MRLGKVTGTARATAKDAQLVGGILLVTDLIDGAGKVVESSIVALDTCGAGVGDTVLITQGSAARLPAGLAGTPIDTAIIAIVDDVNIA